MENLPKHILELINQADKSVSNLKDITKEIKYKRLKGCPNCGCTIYPNKKHTC